MLRSRTKPASSSAPSASTADPLTDGLVDPLVTRGKPKTTREEITAGTKETDPPPTVTTLKDGTPYIPYPEQDKVITGTTKHEVSLNTWSDGSALVANSSSDTGTTSDAASLYEAYAGYSDEHPDWSRERRLTMASREDWNEGGDIVSAKRRDGGGAPKTGRKWAAVIGNNAYTSLEPLKEPIPDAKGMGARWSSEGFPVHEYMDVGADKMTSVFESIPKYAKRGDEVRVFFAGHGLRSWGLAGINSQVDRQTGIPFRDDCMQYGVIGNLAADAVSNGWHLTAIIDACASHGVAAAVQDALVPNTESSKSTDYDINLKEMAEKGLPHSAGRQHFETINEILFKRFTNEHGHHKYGKEGAERLYNDKLKEWGIEVPEPLKVPKT